ncbi:MAG: ATP-binding protein [Candidatus Methanogasteraceae archaeon]
MRFYNRQEDVDVIKNLSALSYNHAHMLVVYGRRRVGKTRLVLESLEPMYFFVDKKTSALLLKEFSEIVRVNSGSFVPDFSNWDDFIRFLFEYSKDMHLIVVFDEFQNFQAVDPAIFSIFQKYWDNYSDTSRILLIFVGSYVGLMKKIFIDEKEPLYGRSTAKIDLKPLNYRWIRKICIDLGFKSEEDIVKIYSTLGGTPRYYQLVESYGLDSYESVLKSLIFGKNALLQDEVRQILINEFGRNYTTYFSILEAVSLGKNTLKEISDITGIPMNSLGKYLNELASTFAIIERREPLLGGKKMGRYFIKDNIVRFWFRFVNPNISFLESGRYEIALEKTMADLPSFVGRVFEDIVTEIALDNLPFKASGIGRWWNRRGDEIDMVAVNGDAREILFGEVKWTNKTTGCGILASLKEKKDLVKWHNGERTEYYLVVSKSGFTPELREIMGSEGVIGWDMQDIARMADL